MAKYFFPYITSTSVTLTQVGIYLVGERNEFLPLSPPPSDISPKTMRTDRLHSGI